MTRPLVFLDTETTGLDPARHELVEVAWAVGDGPVRSLVWPHDLAHPDPQALLVNRYLERQLWDRDFWATGPDRDELLADLQGATLVGANPAFDAAFLRREWPVQPWHHRMLDVQAYGMAALALDGMPGLADLIERLRSRGHSIPQADHTAAADVEATRAVFRALREEVSQRP